MAQRLRQANIAGGFGAGVGAALVMQLVMGVLRFTTNTPSIPELMETRLVYLTGGKIESIFINALGVGGKALLLVFMVEGTLILGGLLGLAFTRFWPLRAPGTLAVASWKPLSGLLYGLLVGLLLNVIFLPLVDQGFFGSAANGLAITAPPDIARAIYGSTLAPIGVPVWLEMFILALVFGLVLVRLLPWRETAAAGVPAPAAGAEMVDRREFVKAVGGVGLAVVGGAVLWGAIRAALTPPPVAGPQLVTDDPSAGADLTPTAEAQVPGGTTLPAATAAADAGQPTAAPDQPTTAPGQPTAAPAGSDGTPGGNTTTPPTPPMTEVPGPTPVPTSAAFANVKPVLVPEITPVDSFYITTKNFIDPTVDGNSWQISFKGLVGNPYTLTLKDIQAMPVVNRVQTLACISNPVGGDLIGNANWKGVNFRDLLTRAKPQDGVVDVIVRGADGYSDSFPLDVAMNNELVLAYQMNGQPLQQKHGYPARLLVPGIYGMKNCKWITEVELVNSDYKGYWEGQGWSDTAVYQTFSRIDYPNTDHIDAKPIYVGGIAWAGNRGIKRVEVSADGGTTWNDAALRPALGKYTWVLWTYPWQPTQGSYTLAVRATDGKGTVQTAQQADTYPDGATGYHQINVRVG